MEATLKMPSRLLLSSMCRSCRHQHISRRAFSSTTPTTASSLTSSIFPDGAPTNTWRTSRPGQTSQPSTDNDSLSKSRNSSPTPTPPTPSKSSSISNLWQDAASETSTRPGAGVPIDEPYHINVYAHKHNMHITFTEPSRNVILSFSCGQIGLKKAQRGTYDAAYQLSTYTMRKMAEKQWRQGGKNMAMNPMRTLRDVKGTFAGGNGIEVVLRGFGPGREAFQKALMGPEGAMVKPLVVKVTDGTRLKFGGTRSPQVRRLG